MLRPIALLFSCALALSAAPALDVWHAKPDIRTALDVPLKAHEGTVLVVR
jgi:hypothetical protein